MNKRLQQFALHRRVEPADDFISSDPTEEKVADVWASLEWQGGSETESGDQQQARERCKISTRFGPGISGCDSSWWATRTNPTSGRLERFNFVSVRDVGDRRRTLEIDAVRVSGG